MIKVSDAIEIAGTIPSWTDPNERQCLGELAQEVGKGRIVEIGALYGGMTAVIALSNPDADITSIDEFSWTPEGYPTASKNLMSLNLRKVGVDNVEILEGDSRQVGLGWSQPIDLLWIDGGHSYEFVYSDLIKFGPHAQVIALHDFGNPFWTSVANAVNDFLQGNHDFHISETVGTVVVLRRMLK